MQQPRFDPERLRPASAHPTRRFATAALMWAAIAPRSALSLELASRRTVAPGDSTVVNFVLAPADTASQALEFDGRLQSSSFAGSNLVLRIRLNGFPLREDRLLNKPLQFATANGKLQAWADADRWRVVYS